MDEDQVRKVIIDVLEEIQQQSGREKCRISGDTRPIGDLDGFDSLNAEEAVVMLSERLGREIEENPFVSRSDSRPLRVREVALRICQGRKAKGASHVKA